MGQATSRDGSSGGSGGTKITKQDRAVLDLKIQRDKLKQYQKRVELILNREHEAAKVFLVKGDKERAKAALRRRRYQQTILEKTDTQLETLQGLVTNIEFSQIEASVVHGLAQGNAVLKEIHKELSLDNVEKLMEETAEAQQYQREVDLALQSKMTAEDEEAISAELEKLEFEEKAGVTKEEEQVPAHIILPDAPTAQPERVKKQEQQRQSKEEEPTREALLA